MSEYKEEYHVFAPEKKERLPVIYNFIYRFKRRNVNTRSVAFNGVTAGVLQTRTFFPWSHGKPITKSVHFARTAFPKQKPQK